MLPLLRPEFNELDPERPEPLWEVRSGTDGDVLGHVQWHKPTNCYMFEPDLGTIFDKNTLHAIADFCARKTALGIGHEKDKRRERRTRATSLTVDELAS